MVNVEIITIGDEILIGQIVDTNSAWMAVELNKAGFAIAQITSVHDDTDHILNALDDALTRADVVLFTGGIGPTKDDITKQTLCRYFNTELVFNQTVLDNIEQLFSNRKYVLNELTRSQAMVPENCTVIMNKVGTAPITWFEKEGKIIVSMPGVPNEMKYAMQTEIIIRLQEYFKTPSIIHKTVLVKGIPESALALKIADWENALPDHLHLAYLPNYSLVKLRLSASTFNELEVSFEINQKIEQLQQILGDAIVAFDDIPLEVLAGKHLSTNNLTLSTAESCTGGNIAHKITEVPGSSNYFKGSVVAYSNEVKTNIIGVNSNDIAELGAVSQQVVEQMAANTRKILKTDIAVATSGIAGPEGGTADKPVGTVWVAVSTATETSSRLFNFGANRIQNIERTTQSALLFLIEKIQ